MQPAPVDLVRRDDANDDSFGTAHDAAVELLALLGRDLLRVVQVRQGPYAMLAEACVVEQHAGDDERPGKRPASRLIRPGDEPSSEPAVELEELLAGPAHEGRG